MEFDERNLKVALVTGSTKGIGYATAKALIEEGYTVVTNSRKEINELDNEFRQYISSNSAIDYIKGDVSKEDDVANIFSFIKEKYGRLDLLVNNVGYSQSKSLIRMKQNNIEEVIQGNLTSAILCSKYAVKYMLQQKCGRIILVSSTAGLHGMPFEAHYSAAKAGLVGFAKSLAKEYGTKGILCNVVAPGVMNKEDTVHMESAKDEVTEKIPLRRMGELEEVSSLIVFLASKNASYITGQVIQVDGGLFV